MSGDGVEQRQRFPPALRDGWFLPDELSFEQRVAMTAAFAERLRFVDLQGHESGHWGELFAGDTSMVMARIASVDREALQAAFLHELDAAPLARLAWQAITLATVLDQWLKSLAPSPLAPAKALAEHLRQRVLHPLGEDLAELFDRHGALAWRGRTLADARAALDPAWFGPRALRRADDRRSERERLRSTFFALLGALGDVQATARELLPASLRTQAHEPAAGLLLASLQLYATVQRRINRFTDRHVDFYYRDCLGLAPRPAVPDRLHLVCDRDLRSSLDVVVPEGTPFSAGKDARGRPIRFVAEQALALGDARVAALCTLRLERDPLISPERELRYVTRAKARQLPVLSAVPLSAASAPPAQPLFGGTQPGAAASPADDATIGLAIASPLWWLAEGERELRITLRVDGPGESDAATAALARRLAANPADGATLLPALFRRYAAHDAAKRASTEPTATAAADRADDPDALARGALARLARRSPADAVVLDGYTLYATELAVQAPDAASFVDRLGRLFAHWLVAETDGLAAPDRQALGQAAARHLGSAALAGLAATSGDPLALLDASRTPERELIFDRVFNGLFDVALSGEAGWMAAPDTYIGRSTADTAAGPRTPGASGAPRPAREPARPRTLDGSGRGFQVTVRLRPEDGAVVGCDPALHGAGWGTAQPVVRLLLRAQARLYPYSLLEPLRLREAVLAVSVRGLRRIGLHNQLGPLDPAKPFHPFGPLPAVGSYLVFGAPEIARKNLDALRLHVEWSGLPTDAGGFATWYDGYEGSHRNGDFTASVAILRDGQWQTAGSAATVRPGTVPTVAALPGLPLFRDLDPARRVDTHSVIAVDRGALHHHQRATSEPLEYGVGARNGFFRVQLAGPPDAFGHAAYPMLLTEVVSANARRRRHLALPNPPYTPVIERLTLDYRAHTTLQFGSGAAADRPEGGRDAARDEIDRVYHLLPFGLEQIHPASIDAQRALLPRFEHDGNLYIGLTGSPPQGLLTLLFHLRDEAAVEPPPGMARPALHWACLRSNRWQPLPPACVLSDTTDGFLTSGIVTLDIPPAIDARNSVLPAGLHWLRLAADSGFRTFAALHGVHAQALTARRVLEADAAPIAAGLPPGSVQQPLVSVPGLAAVHQVGPSFGMRDAEDREQWRTRAGERLRHKQRAVTPWDIERLVLEQFPEVFKVKCFPHQTSRTGRSDTGTAADGSDAPGQVLVVVVPAAPRNEAADRTRGIRLNSVVLHRIREFLATLASPGARLEVRNAAYERVQVRCTVRLLGGRQAGVVLRRIEDAIIDQLSPWVDDGYGPRFDWLVRSEDIEARLRRVDGVDFVTKLSLLHIARTDHGVYTLADTARGAASARAVRAGVAEVRPLSPWSLVLPTRTHIVATTEQFTDADPVPTGIARLAVGSTFIVGRPST